MTGQDLLDQRHDCLLHRYPGAREFVWTLVTADGPQRFEVTGTLESDDGDVLTGWALAGRGIVLKPVFEIAEHLAPGALVPVVRGEPRRRTIQLACLYPAQAAAGPEEPAVHGLHDRRLPPRARRRARPAGERRRLTAGPAEAPRQPRDGVAVPPAARGAGIASVTVSRLPRSGPRPGRALLRRLLVALHRRAGAHEVAVAEGVVDAVDRRPVLVDAEGARRVAGLLARVGPVPVADEVLDGVRARCGAGCSPRPSRPVSIAAASSAMASIAVQKRSSSALGSLSVGSIISVPATGQLIVGAWKPQSISRLATSSTVTPGALLHRAGVDDALVGDPAVAREQDRVRRRQPGGDVVGVEDGDLRRLGQPGAAHHQARRPS